MLAEGGGGAAAQAGHCRWACVTPAQLPWCAAMRACTGNAIRQTAVLVTVDKWSERGHCTLLASMYMEAYWPRGCMMHQKRSDHACNPGGREGQTWGGAAAPGLGKPSCTKRVHDCMQRLQLGIHLLIRHLTLVVSAKASRVRGQKRQAAQACRAQARRLHEARQQATLQQHHARNAAPAVNRRNL